MACAQEYLQNPAASATATSEQQLRTRSLDIRRKLFVPRQQSGVVWCRNPHPCACTPRIVHDHPAQYSTGEVPPQQARLSKEAQEKETHAQSTVQWMVCLCTACNTVNK